MGLMNEMKESSDFEREFNLRKRKIDDLNAISPETLSLQIFILDYDSKRYLRKNTSSWLETAYFLKGVANCYQVMIDDGTEKWLNKKLLKEEWEEGLILKTLYTMQNDEEKVLLASGIQSGIAGLIEGQLYYNVHGKSPRNNIGYIRAKKKWEEYEQENVKQIVRHRLEKRHEMMKETLQDEVVDNTDDEYDNGYYDDGL